jgi:hypothetical protein
LNLSTEVAIDSEAMMKTAEMSALREALENSARRNALWR